MLFPFFTKKKNPNKLEKVWAPGFHTHTKSMALEYKNHKTLESMCLTLQNY